MYVLLLVSLCIIVALLAVTFDGGQLLELACVRRTRGPLTRPGGGGARSSTTTCDLDEATRLLGCRRRWPGILARTTASPAGGIAVVVTVNIPPKSGVCAGMAGHVEVILTENVSGCFSVCLTNSSATAAGRGVARGWRKDVGLLALAPSGVGLQVGNLGRLRVVGGPICVNSTSGGAFTLGLGTVEADSTRIVGTLSGLLSNLLGTVETSAQAQTDPLLKLAAPDASTLSKQTYAGGNATLSPGVYVGGIKINSPSAVTLQPGIYVLDGGGISVAALATLTGNQAMIYNTGISQPSGAISITGNGAVTLTPPNSGTYKGISIFQDRAASTAVKITGNGKLSITGTIYAPGAQVQLTGNGTGNTAGGWVIASTVKVAGTGNVDLSQATDRPLIPDVHLVE